jgi:hypothetical protein
MIFRGEEHPQFPVSISKNEVVKPVRITGK